MNAIHIVTFDYSFQTYAYRAPMKFGGMVVEQVTILDVRCTLSDSNGRTSHGFGSMPLGNVWSFPSKTLSYEQTLTAMRHLAAKVSSLWTNFPERLHPIQIGFEIEPAVFEAAHQTTLELNLSEPIPALCALVVSSPFDASVHDAYGKLHGRSVYDLYGPGFLPESLGTFLGASFERDYLNQYIERKPKAVMPLYHLVGALDPIDPPARTVGDGLPEHLAAWIIADGLSHLKIKLDGRDLDWDVDRVSNVYRIARSTAPACDWKFSLDFNERCESPEYVAEFLDRLESILPAALNVIQYIEQPTPRDLTANRGQRYHEISKRVPVVIDESLIGLESLELARELGYSGCALKACKGQTQSLLMGAAAQKLGMFLCVQDLTCPGASLIQSASLAAHVPGIAAIEANSRQYVPAANAGWDERFPGIFRPRNGVLETGSIIGQGLGAVP